MGRVEGVQQELINTQKETEQNIFDFARIKEQSKNIKSYVHSIRPAQHIDAEEELEFIKLYLEILLNMARLEENQKKAVSRMIYIQWVMDQKRGKYYMSRASELSLKDLFLESMNLTKDSYTKFSECIKKYSSQDEPIIDSVALYSLEAAFIFDTIIVAYISGEPAVEIKKYLVDLFTILGFTKDKVRIAAKYAKESLCENLDDDVLLDFHIIGNEAKEELEKMFQDFEKSILQQRQDFEDECKEKGITMEDLSSLLGQIFGNS